MNKTEIISIKESFEAELLGELLKQNGIENEIQEENDSFKILVSKIDVNKAQIILDNYNNSNNKKEIGKTESLKNNLIKILALIGGAVLFYYIMSLLFKLTLKLF